MEENEILQTLAEIREEAAHIRDSLESPEVTRRRSRILLASTISSVFRSCADASAAAWRLPFDGLSVIERRNYDSAVPP
jgi:hypothetical protein